MAARSAWRATGVIPPSPIRAPSTPAHQYCWTPAPAPPAQTKPDTPAPSEEDYVKIYALNYDAGRPVEYWLGTADRRRVLLNTAKDLPDMQAIYPTVDVRGTGRCDRWKSFHQEVKYNQFV